MPAKREHLRASRILLGTQTPVVHELLELAVKRQGMEHGYLISNSDYLGMIGQLLGQEAKRGCFTYFARLGDSYLGRCGSFLLFYSFSAKKHCLSFSP